ncbi:MAG: lytic transglycosylase domain-containing protein [Gammaproteobacteria bacterium]
MTTAHQVLPLSLRALLLTLMSLFSVSVSGNEISVPLRLDYRFLLRVLQEKVYSDPGNTVQVFDERKECSSVILSAPRIGKEGERIRIVTSAEARLGIRIIGSCWHIPQWQGLIEVFEEAAIAPGQSTIEFHVVDSNLLDREGNKPLVTGTLWDWIKNHVNPRLAALKIDLNPALQEIQALVPLMLSRSGADAVQRTIESVKLSGLQMTDTGIVIELQFSIPEFAAPTTPSLPEPALTLEALQRWEVAWRNWDAFLTFVIKRAAKDTGSEDLQRALLDVLLESRYDLQQALVVWKVGKPDPVRRLFLNSWDRLAPILQQLETALPGTEAARYLSFITAADALKAMDQVGDQIGFEISADGLRRMVRMLAPEFTEDPLIYDFEVDPELRRRFGFGPVLPVSQHSFNMNPDEVFSFASAWAADNSPVKKRDHWVPNTDDIETYLMRVNDLLKRVANATIRSKHLMAKYQGFFRRLSLATAWQESCWRQFVIKSGQIKPLLSDAGAIGIMQVNPHVWRGFYHIEGLRGDISYNAAAGNEILHHYLTDYVLNKAGHKRKPNLDLLARLAYVAYNGGPSHFERYRKRAAAQGVYRVAQAFWTKYRAIKKNGASAVANCYVTP